MIIGACGFGSTGSSAVSDYLCEYGIVQVLDKLEFTWVWGVDGIIDLEYHLKHPHGRTLDSIYAIKRYRELAMQSLHMYEKVGGIDSHVFMESVDRFLDRITQIKWHWNYKRPSGFWEVNYRRVVDRIIPKIEIQKRKQINCWPLEEVFFSVLPNNFDDAAMLHVQELLVAMGADLSKPLVLDQPFPGNNPQSCLKFFNDPYAIVVDRDPRDNYVFANTKLLGQNHFMAVSPVEDFVKYYRALRENQPYNQADSRVLSIKFEDMVYHYEDTTKKIRQFLNLGENPNPKSIFDPAISMPNTRVWLRYPQFAKDIEYIEKELPEYLFDYTGCPEPDLTGKMFFGKSPKNK